MCRFLCECKWINVLLLDCIVKFMLSFVRNTKLSSKVAVPFYTPTSNERSSCCSTPSPTFGVISVLILAVLTGVYQCLTVLLICIPLMTYDLKHIFIFPMFLISCYTEKIPVSYLDHP